MKMFPIGYAFNKAILKSDSHFPQKIVLFATVKAR